MNVQDVYNAYIAKQFKRLSIDDLLVSTGNSHVKLRQYCYRRKLPQPPLSPGLIDDVLSSKLETRAELAKHFNITLIEANTCLYGTKSSLSTLAKKAKATTLRANGATEADIAAQGLPMDLSILANEVTAKIAAGEKRDDLSALYGVCVSRISQLNHNSMSKPRLSKEHKQEIKANVYNKSAVDLAKQYNTTKNTIHVIQREQ